MLAPQKVGSCPLCVITDSPYSSAENSDPLGAYAMIGRVNVPENYAELDVRNKIALIADANSDGECDLELGGLCTIVYRGDNHFGYMGYRSVINPQIIRSSGTMDLVAQHWESENN
ncbi:MAG TPA: hypothetical protein VIP70_00840 [Nitrososphaeraceae archaeon]